MDYFFRAFFNCYWAADRDETMIKSKHLPAWLQGISPEPDEVEEYNDAASNALRLLDYLNLNDDVLSCHDMLVMIVIELSKAKPREDIVYRLKGKYNVIRNRNERQELKKAMEKNDANRYR